MAASLALAACDRAAAQHTPAESEPDAVVEVIVIPDVPVAPDGASGERRQIEWPGGGQTVTYGAER